MVTTVKEKMPTGWTLEAFMEHTRLIQEKDKEFRNEQDRRYTEGNELRAIALKIKETADNDARILAREAQVYKDQQADIMREKSLASSGIYATNESVILAIEKIEKVIKPLAEYVASQQGVDKGMAMTSTKLIGLIGVTGVIVGIIFTLINNLGI